MNPVALWVKMLDKKPEKGHDKLISIGGNVSLFSNYVNFHYDLTQAVWRGVVF